MKRHFVSVLLSTASIRRGLSNSQTQFRFGKKANLKMSVYKIVLVRHGESEWNLENRFCGWHDAELSPKGLAEAKQAGKWIKDAGLTFDVAYTSVLKRAIKTLFFIQEELDLHWIPVTRTWRLNERMYGGLQGLNKSETAAKHGEEQVKVSSLGYIWQVSLY